MSVINVLYCFDSKFWHMAAVSMESLLANAAPDTKIMIYCMVAPHTRGRFKISRIIKKHCSGAGLVWHVVKKPENPFVSYEFSRWSPVIWYRLFAHRIFKDVDKMIYLDSDTIICRDIAELFNTDMSNYCVGAIRDLAPVNDKFHRIGIQIKQFSEKYLKGKPYYNSGVLLLNMKEIAKYEHLLFETNIPLVYPDQDLLNVAFVNKIKSLPLKYNLAPGVKIPVFFPKTEADEIFAGKRVIVHCYSVKPYQQDASEEVYKLFADYASAIGMRITDFEKWDNKYTKKYESPIPGIYIHNRSIVFLGMRIKI